MVHEVHPELAGAAADYGLQVSSHALMSTAAADVAAPEQIDGFTLRVVDAGDPTLAAGRAVADVAFRAGGTRVGPEGVVERDKALVGLRDGLVAHLRSRAERGLTITAVAESPTDGVVAVGSYQPM